MKFHLPQHHPPIHAVMTIGLAALLLNLWAGRAYAEAWRLIARDHNASQYVDTRSIISAVKAAEYWDRLQFARPQSIGDGKWIKEIRSLSIADCTHRMIAGEYYAIYDMQDKLIDIYKVQRVFKTVADKSKAAALLQYVCGRKPDPAMLAKRKGGAAALLAELTAPDRPGMGNLPRRDSRTDKPNRYAAYIRQEANASHVSPALVRAIMMAESGNNPYAVSPKGALGLMQLLPATARRFGVSQLFDPEENIKAGTKYLSYLLRLFNNDIQLAVAAYNAGEKAVIKYGNRVPPYKETRQYVPKVISLYNRFK